MTRSSRGPSHPSSCSCVAPPAPCAGALMDPCRACDQTLRHHARLHHIGMGAVHKNRRVIMLVHGLDVRVLAEDGELLRHLTFDPTRDYQPQASTMT